MVWVVSTACVLPTEAADRYLFDRIHYDLSNDVLDEVVAVVNDFGSSKYVIGAVLLTTILGRDEMRDTGLLVDRKSTRLNSSHKPISYAVFCLKKKNQTSFRTFNL